MSQRANTRRATDSSLALRLHASGEHDKTEENYWKGFAEVWYQASALNRFVMKALNKINVPAIALPPSANVIASGGKISIWETTAIRMALAAGLVPVIHGDVTFDEIRRWNDPFHRRPVYSLARALGPDSILLAGLESAVWEDFPARTRRWRPSRPTYLLRSAML